NQEVRPLCTSSWRRVVAEFSVDLCINSTSSWRETILFVLEASNSMTLSDAFFTLFRVAE
ncbi:MAG TPA: hypothetical protein VKG86_06240, partial [Terracidiphilus sp.]|nr:hypothetical protein [Terracidiphilus sp.]